MKKNLTLVCTLLLAVCLKTQTAVNISGASTATWTALSFHSLFKGLKQITKKFLLLFLTLIVAGLFGQTRAQIYTIYGAPYVRFAPSEAVTVPFTAEGKTTTNLYSGLVLIKVSGTGYSYGDWPNDAFYLFPEGDTWHDANGYQLAVTVEGSVVNNSDDAAYRHIVYDLSAGTAVTPPYTPAYRNDHTYEFIVDLSSLVPAVAEPSAIRFGVIDNGYYDNSGSYTVQITQLACLGGGVGTVFYEDADHDGYGNPLKIRQACFMPPGYVTDKTDCDDNNFNVNPQTKWFKDADKDGFGDGTYMIQCARLTGYKLRSELTTIEGDCNDADASINPETIWYKDADNDGYSDGSTTKICERPTGYKLASEIVGTSGDCDDTKASINPATVWYKDADNDGYSDGTTKTQCTRPEDYKLASELTATSGDCDDSDPSIKSALKWYKDADNDGYSDGIAVTQCERPTGYKLTTELTATSGDCDDKKASINPATVWYKDADNDGYSDGTIATQCTRPTGYKLSSELTATSGDCNDTNGSLNPATVWYKDGDNDGYSDGTTKTQCTRPTGYKPSSELTATSGDCDDTKAELNPATVWYKDADNDGYSNGTTAKQCTRPTGYKLSSELTATSGDCDDTNGSLNPATVWYKDGDNDGYSDGTAKTQCTKPAGYKLSAELTSTSGDCNDNDVAINPKTLWVLDNDKDGYYFGSPVIQCSSPGTGYVIKASQQGGDCNDNDAGINPGAVEVCGNGIDDNCNGKVDEAGCTLCANGTGLTTTNITSSGATLKWVALANPEQWEVEYKKTATGSKWITITLPGTARSLTLSSLLADQNYNWHIRAKCNNTWTDFLNAVSFKTLSAQQTSNAITQQARSLKDVEEESQSLKLYPNPSKGQFVIKLQLAGNVNTTAKIELVNMMGQTVSTNNASVNNGTLYKNVNISSSLAAGIYIARITLNNKTYTTKLIYEK